MTTRTPKIVHGSDDPTRAFMATYIGQGRQRATQAGRSYIPLYFIGHEDGRRRVIRCILHPNALYFALQTIQSIRKAAGKAPWVDPMEQTYKTFNVQLAGCKGAHVQLLEHKHYLPAIRKAPLFSYSVAPR